MARARSNVVKTLATVAFFFIFCWTWNQTYYLMFYLDYQEHSVRTCSFTWITHYLMFYLDYPLIDFTSAFYNFTVIMVFLNCCVNPVIYSIKYEQVVRSAVHAVYSCASVNHNLPVIAARSELRKVMFFGAVSLWFFVCV